MQRLAIVDDTETLATFKRGAELLGVDFAPSDSLEITKSFCQVLTTNPRASSETLEQGEHSLLLSCLRRLLSCFSH